jgi:hypothetical protein
VSGDDRIDSAGHAVHQPDYPVKDRHLQHRTSASNLLSKKKLFFMAS